MQLSSEQLALIGLLASQPGAIELLQTTVMGYLHRRYADDVEADPTIENPEAIMEILGKGSGYISDLIAYAKSQINISG